MVCKNLSILQAVKKEKHFWIDFQLSSFCSNRCLISVFYVVVPRKVRIMSFCKRSHVCLHACYHGLSPKLLIRIRFNQVQELCHRICWDNFILSLYVSDTGCKAESLTRPYYVHYMHQQFNIQQLCALPTLYLCVLYLSENKQRLVPLTA